MISALIFVMSFAALLQFGVFAWRAALLSVAAKPVSEEIRVALGSYADSDTVAFQSASEWLKMSPNLGGPDRGTWTVSAYFIALRAMNAITNAVAPSKAGCWQQEMSACARYIAVVADERLQRNRLCIADMQSY